MSAPVATVLVVDDDLSSRQALDTMLRSAGYRVETFASAEEFLEREPLDGLHCLVLDVDLPQLSGLELQARLSPRHPGTPGTPIVFITGHGDIPMTVQAMRAGAIEFLTKPLEERALLDGVARALAHHASSSQHDEALTELRARYDTLTPREKQVMALVTQGLLNKQAGAALGTSEITIKVQRRQAMMKMKARSLPELVRMAGRLGLAGS